MIRRNDDTWAVFGTLEEHLCWNHGIQVDREEVAAMALDIVEIIKSHLIVGVWSNEETKMGLLNAIDDFFFDVVRDQKDIDMPTAVLHCCADPSPTPAGHGK